MPREAIAGEHLLPKIVGLEAVRIRRIAGTVAPTLIEGQEPRALDFQMRAEAHLVLVDREVRDAAAELEQLLAQVAVTFVLLHGVVHRLLGQAVLQLEGGHRQPVDEQAQVQREPDLLAAVAKLAGDAEAVGGVALGRLRVAGRRRAVEEIDVVRAVLDAGTQHVDGAALGDLALQAGQELAPRRPVLAQRQRIGRLRLGFPQKARKLRQVHAVLAVIVIRVPADPARRVGRGPLVHLAGRRGARIAGRAGQRRSDQPLEAALGGVRGGRHAPGSPAGGKVSMASRSLPAASIRSASSWLSCSRWPSYSARLRRSCALASTRQTSTGNPAVCGSV